MSWGYIYHNQLYTDLALRTKFSSIKSYAVFSRTKNDNVVFCCSSYILVIYIYTELALRTKFSSIKSYEKSVKIFKTNNYDYVYDIENSPSRIQLRKKGVNTSLRVGGVVPSERGECNKRIFQFSQFVSQFVSQTRFFHQQCNKRIFFRATKKSTPFGGAKHNVFFMRIR